MVKATASLGLPTGDTTDASGARGLHPPLPGGAAAGAADLLGLRAGRGRCLAFLEGEGFTSWGDVGPAHLRRFGAVLGLAASDDGFDAACPEQPPVLVVVIAAVGEQPVGLLARPAGLASDRPAVQVLEQRQ